jgi:hypothetical protein
MALNLGQTLRDAVDGLSLDELVGEDPADVDLPALSARIRRRRRARATARSAVGVAAAGAITLVGVHGGLARRGAENLAGPGVPTPDPSAGRQVAPRVAPPPLVLPMSPLSASQLSAAKAQLCGRDVSAMPAVDSTTLVPWNVATTNGGSDLGTLSGRTLTATVVADGTEAASAHGQIVLTTAGTVVAVGAPQPDPGNSLFEVLPTGQATGISPVAVSLAPCPSPGGTPDSVPAGTYAVQYLVTTSASAAIPGTAASAIGATTGRAAAGPWSVTLLDQPAPTTGLPNGFPATEVPVIGGTLLTAGPCTAAPDGWSLSVAVTGDDAITRAADSLRAAGAGVGAANEAVDRCTTPGQAETPEGVASLQATLSTLQADLVTMQTRREQLQTQVNDANRALDALVASHADQQQRLQATIRMQQAQSSLLNVTAEVAQQQALITSQSALIAQAQAAGGAALEPGVATDSYSAQVVSNGGGSYTVYGPRGFTAVTNAWTVRVTESMQNAQTVLTYSVLRR